MRFQIWKHSYLYIQRFCIQLKQNFEILIFQLKTRIWKSRNTYKNHSFTQGGKEGVRGEIFSTVTQISRLYIYNCLLIVDIRAQNLRQGNVMKTSFKKPGFTNGVRQFCEYQYICKEILFFSVCLHSPFYSNLLSQNLHKC